MRGWEQNKNKINPLERMEGGTQQDILIFLPRIKRIGRIVSYAGLRARQKPNKPLGEDGGLEPWYPSFRLGLIRASS